MVRLFFARRCWTKWSNFPKKYIENQKARLKDDYWEKENPLAVGKPDRLKKYPFKHKEERYLSKHPPWAMEARDDSQKYTEQIACQIRPISEHEWWMFRGDRVQILVGKDKGKQGTVDQYVRYRNWVYVKYLNCAYEMEGQHGEYPGMLVPREMPLIIYRDVSLVDPSDNLPCEIEWRYTETGERVRVSTRSGRIIPISVMEEETRDYKTKETYEEGSKDTPADVVQETTFKAKLKTFEEDRFEEMGIVETRKRHPTYWY